MPNESSEKPPEIVRHGHEPSDASPKGIAIFALSLIVGAILMHIALYVYFSANAKFLPVPHPVLAARKSDIAPNRDLVLFRQQQQSELDGYGWVDRNRGVVRIPIERAMELLAERGLPVRTGPSKNEKSPLELQKEKAKQK